MKNSGSARVRAVATYLVALGAGILLALVKAVYSFLPFFNVIDVAVFGAVGMFLGRWRRGAWWLLGACLAVPALTMSLLFCARLGSTQLMRGIGTGWVVSAAVVPLAALAGTYLGYRRTREIRGLSGSDEG